MTAPPCRLSSTDEVAEQHDAAYHAKGCSHEIDHLLKSVIGRSLHSGRRASRHLYRFETVADRYS